MCESKRRIDERIGEIIVKKKFERVKVREKGKKKSECLKKCFMHSVKRSLHGIKKNNFV